MLVDPPNLRCRRASPLAPDPNSLLAGREPAGPPGPGLHLGPRPDPHRAIRFADRGNRPLKGVPGRWQLFAADPSGTDTP